MQPEAKFGHTEAAARPLAELLACPPAIGNLLNASARSIEFEASERIFRQGALCRGLYLVISGLLLRKAERLNSRLTLGPVRAGELVELAAALGDGRHTYTLVAQTSGSFLLLPYESLQQVFIAHPPLKLQLLAELAREVSRAYTAGCVARMTGIKHRSNGTLTT